MSRVYDHVLDKLANKQLDWDSDTIKLVAVTSGYTFSAAHTNLSQISGGNRVYTSTLSGLSISSGKLDATDPTPAAPSAGSTVVAYVAYSEGVSESVSWLWAYLDTMNTGQPISIATNGAGIEVVFHADGVLRLRSTSG